MSSYPFFGQQRENNVFGIDTRNREKKVFELVDYYCLVMEY